MPNQNGEIHPLKNLNNNLILNALSEMKTATRKQLAERTGLSQPTVNAIVQELEQSGIVYPGKFAASDGGRRPQYYILQTDHLRAAAIRVQPHAIMYHVATVDGNIIKRGTLAVSDPHSYLEKLQALIHTLKKQDDNIRVVSVGVPGVVSTDGLLYAIPHVPSLEGVALSRILSKTQGVPVYVENDMNLVALGSTISDSDMVFVHIGRGVGAGVIMNRRIVRGFSNFAGEIAYMYKGAETKNSCETLEYLLEQAGDLKQKAQLMANLVINIICLLNPPVIAFGGALTTKELLQHLRHMCELQLPQWTLPSFHLMTEEDAAYEKGLLTLVEGVLSRMQFQRVKESMK